MHFLMIDRRFGVPIFVFLEHDPDMGTGSPTRPGRWVTLDPVVPRESKPGVAVHGVAQMSSIGGNPQWPDRFAEFSSDGEVAAAGFALIEPRYVGPSWETYLSVFKPEGGKRNALPTRRPRDGAKRAEVTSATAAG